MSSSYHLFTEGFVDGKWVCLNAYLKKNDDYEIVETYYSGSRSYFSSTFDKLEEIGQSVRKEDLSQEVRHWLGVGERGRTCIVHLEDIRKTMPHAQKYECHGYVEKNMIFLLESNEIEDIYEYLSPDEYLELDEEVRKSYQYYEWNDAMGWYTHFIDLLERIKWQQYEWNITHNFRSAIENVRILALHSC